MKTMRSNRRSAIRIRATAGTILSLMMAAVTTTRLPAVDAVIPSTPSWHPAWSHDRHSGGPSTKVPSNTKLPDCAFHLYRHLSKTGGTTLRFIFDKQTAMGEWEYPLIYGFKEEEWTALLARWRDAVGQWKSGEREGPRTLVEVRGNWPSNWPAENFARVMQDVSGEGLPSPPSLPPRDSD